MKLSLPITAVRIVVAAVFYLVSSINFYSVYAQACQFQQGQNGGVNEPVVSPVQFERGNSNSSKSHFAEGNSVPYRIEFTTLEPNQQYRVRISFDVKKNGKYAIDYITGFQNLQEYSSIAAEQVDPLLGTALSGLAGVSFSTIPIPVPDFSSAAAFNTVAAASFSQLIATGPLNPESVQPISPYVSAVRQKGNLVIWNAVLQSAQYIGGVNTLLSTTSVAMDIVFTTLGNSNNVVLAWGGHIASLKDWGQGNSASAIPGSPYHMFVEYVAKVSDETYVCSGNMDCQIASDAVTPAPSCMITGPSRLCESSLNATYTAILDASINGAVTYNWSLINLSGTTAPTLIAPSSGVSTVDTLLQQVLPSDSFLVRLLVQRGGISTYCYLGSVDSPGVKVKKQIIAVETQATPTIIDLNVGSTSQLLATAQLNNMPDSVNFAYQWAIAGSGGYAAGSFDNSNLPNPVFTASMAGQYELKVIVTQSEAPYCIDSAQLIINVTGPQACPQLYTQPICENQQGQFPVSALPQQGVNYYWSATSGATFLSSGADTLVQVIAGAQDFNIELQLDYSNPLLANLVCTYPVKVNPLPLIDAGQFDPTCVTAIPVGLNGFPAGGSWSGVGVDSGFFIPSIAGAGTHVLHYSYTDSNGCTAVDSTSIVVNDLPVLYPGAYGPLCIDASPLFLQATPTGGQWSGVGVTGNTFDPSEAGVGTHTLTYTLSVVGGCVVDTAVQVVVNALPVVQTGSYGPYCSQDDPITLSATPTGGSWSGIGISGAIFSPSVAGAGTHVITYYYTDQWGCSATGETSIIVNNCAVTNACTYTQGYYGSVNGQSCDQDSLYRSAVSLIKKLLLPSPLVIGSGTRTLTITVNDSARLNAVMPGGGTPRIFSHTGNITLSSSQFAAYRSSNGRINNILLSQTITLGLNLRIKDDLAPFILLNGYLHTQRTRSCTEGSGVYDCSEDTLAIKAWLMKKTVIDYLQATSDGTVLDLFNLANQVLSGVKVPGQLVNDVAIVPTLSDIVYQIDVINNAFDQCRVFIDYYPIPTLCNSALLSSSKNQSAVTIEKNEKVVVKAFPNPFHSIVNFSIYSPILTNVTIELFDMQGKLISKAFSGVLQANENRIIALNVGVTKAPIAYRVVVAQKIVTGLLLPVQ